MNKITDLVKHHQVAAFFLIAFAISWGLAFSSDAVLNQDQGLFFPLAFVATCGPGLAGIITSKLINTHPKQGSRKAFWIAFFVAWVVSVLVCLANFIIIEQVPFSPAVVVTFTIYFGHLLVSALIVWIYSLAGGSILVAGITHAALNTVQAFIPYWDVRSLYPILLIAALILILVDRMWKKLPADHPVMLQAPKQVS